MMTYLKTCLRELEKVNPSRYVGKVTKIAGLSVESNGPQSTYGELCYIYMQNGQKIPAEVVGFRENTVILMPIGELSMIMPGSDVVGTTSSFSVKVGESLIGRILDGLGNPIDDKGPLALTEERSMYSEPPNPLTREKITEPIGLGIRALDGLLTCGRGQRLGIFSGSGVGKSTLLGKIAKESTADVNVIALIGERGKEVREFVENQLGEGGLAKSVVVVVTSDKSPLLRVKGAYTAMTISEYFRDEGRNVMLLVDSITRFAHALREIGLSVGEPPTTRGYTPSVFSSLPKLLERAGNSDKGSITGIFTVLVEGDDFDEPVTDSVRSILDGHIILSRKLFMQGQYPALDVMASVSRCMVDVVSPEQQEAADLFKRTYATYMEVEDMVNLGAYKKGVNKEIDFAINMMPRLKEYIKQGVSEECSFEESVSMLSELFAGD
ncbi:MAG: FliI/YscN family ATPase [Candidatus Anammoxibacter sp.]